MVSSQDIPSLMSQAVAHHSAGRLSQAEALYRRVLESDPHIVDARYNLGIIHQSRGDGEEAIACFRQAIEQAPDFTMAHLALSNALQDTDRQEESIACLKTLVSVAPDFPQGQFNLGFALKGADQGEEAEAALKRGLALMPDYAEAWNILGEIQRDRGEVEAAQSSFQRALELKSDLSVAHINFATLLRDTGRLMEAEAAFSRALDANPDDAGLHNNLGLLLMLEGRMAESGAACGRALEIMPDYAAAHSNLLLSMNYGTQDTAAVLAAHLDYGAVHDLPAGKIAAHDNDRNPERKLKVGYVSSDLRRHSVSCFLEPLLAAHDPGSVEVTCYAEVARPDEVTQRLQSLVAHWRSVVGMSDDAAAQLIHDDGIDILVDLNGHTAGNRLPVFARKPAPVQVTWLGYPNTTGLSAMEYRVVDGVTDPEETQATMSERLLRLEGCFLCYGPPHTDVEVAVPPFVENGHITFGSFNNLSKMSDGVVAAWSKVLDAVPGSRLYLKCAQLTDEELRKRMEERFAGHGIPPERLELAGYAASLEDHLGAYGKMDIALDPFPYNGTTTTCEALWMGVPVITLEGAHHGGRVGASLLGAAGLGELVAGDEDSYLALAVALAADTARLKELRASLRERMQASPLTDAAAFAAKIEDAYRTIWKTWVGK
ncbi:MAG: tetratricopeptide repeat protein [Alphaproteobacteria bacterium]|nr:tetratricopeptide repeat protein [Alphaproteobacteria bacterium]